jgi:predicted ATP-binding protein involved in virulence
MKIHTLRIKNFKAIEEKTFSFKEQLTVLIGNNGSGKSTLLDALAVAVGGYLEGIDEATNRFIEKDEVRRQSFGRQSFELQLPVEVEAWGKNAQKDYNWIRTIEKSDGRNTRIKTKSVKDLAQNYQNLVRKGDKSTNLPLFVYHGTGRLWAEHKEKKEKIGFTKAGSRLEGYTDCMSPKSSSKQFLSWYKTYFDAHQKFSHAEDQTAIAAFNATISKVVPEWTDIAYDFVEDDLVGSYAKDGVIHYLPYRLLSDGYRNMIGMIADIAYRCIKLNPHLGSKAVEETEGLVMIDEIDLHLHPKWQQKICEDLKKAFPNIQFVVSTHSPFIVQSLKASELIILDETFKNEKDPFRNSIVEVAEELMQVPNVERSQRFNKMEEVASEYFNCIAEGQTEEKSEKVRQLKARLDELQLQYSDDPAYVALMKAERNAQKIVL